MNITDDEAVLKLPPRQSRPSSIVLGNGPSSVIIDIRRKTAPQMFPSHKELTENGNNESK